MIRTFAILFLGLILLASCNEKKTKQIIDNKDKIDILNKKPLNDKKDTLDNVQYIVENGEIIDTIFLDSLCEKAILNDILKTDKKTFLSFAVFSTGESKKEEKIKNFNGHFLCELKQDEFPMKVGQTFKTTNQEIFENAINLGNSCSNEKDFIKIEKCENITFDGLYFNIKVPQCSDWYDHLIIKYKNGQFIRLFSIESDEFFEIKMLNDSILNCHYREVSENDIEYFDYKYDLKNRIEIK